MAVFSMTSCYVAIGTVWAGGTAPGDPGTQTVSGTLTATDLSTMVASVDLSFDAEELDYTNFGSGGWRQKISGLKAGTLQLNFNQDFAASKVDALIGLGGSVIPFGGTGPYYCEVKATSAARGATNPSYVMQVVPVAYQPLTGAAGALATLSIRLPTTGQIARLTA
jgi:hypothetical protein